MSFAALIGHFNGLFSRAFWFGSFLPLVIFAAVNLVVASLLFPDSVRWDDWLKIADSMWTNLTLTIVGLVVLAYALTPLLTPLRGVLDGTLLPEAVHNWLRDERTGEARALRAANGRAQSRYVEFEDMAAPSDSGLFGKLRGSARSEGVSTGGKTERSSLATVRAKIDALVHALDEGRALDRSRVADVGSLLEAELRATNADVVAALDKAQDIFVGVLRDARDDSRHRFSTATQRVRGLALYRPQATRIGDARVQVEHYPEAVYGADFTFIWPRVRLVIPKESPLLDRIAAAQGQVDFAVLSLVLTSLFALIWLPVAAIYSTSPWPLLVIGATVPPIALFLYELSVESQLAFGEVIKLVIDQHRLDLLTKVLRQPLPATLSDERRFWKALCLAEEPGTNTELIYRHPSGGAAS